jgi:hypothetical protein
MHWLIQKCVEGDGEAWSDLWLRYDHFAARPVRRLLERVGFGAIEADEVALAVFEKLYVGRARRLHAFRGTTDAELHNRLIHVATNMTRDIIESRWRAKKRQRAARKRMPHPDRGGPTEQDVAAEAKGIYRVTGAQEFEVAVSWWWTTSEEGEWSIDQWVNEPGTMSVSGKISYTDEFGQQRIARSPETSV